MMACPVFAPSPLDLRQFFFARYFQSLKLRKGAGLERDYGKGRGEEGRKEHALFKMGLGV